MKKFVMNVNFPEGLKVDVQAGDFLVRTDQAVASGGSGSAPEPFILFLSSIATCAGIYALRFCQSREIDTKGMALSMTCEWNGDAKRYDRFVLDLALPPDFPEKYTQAVIRSMDLCSVKKHIQEPPEFVVTASRSSG